MDMLFSVLTSSSDHKRRKLVGRALECATLTGEHQSNRKRHG